VPVDFDTLAALAVIERIDNLHWLVDGTSSFRTLRRLIHHIYQHATAIVSPSPISKFGNFLSYPERRDSRTADPALSTTSASSIISEIPRALHKSVATRHRNSKCFMSSGPSWQIGHSPEVPICRLTKILFKGRIPCNALQINILILLGILSFQMVFQIRLVPELPGCAS
jgi:hypothetical protein